MVPRWSVGSGAAHLYSSFLKKLCFIHFTFQLQFSPTRHPCMVLYEVIRQLLAHGYSSHWQSLPRDFISLGVERQNCRLILSSLMSRIFPCRFLVTLSYRASRTHRRDALLFIFGIKSCTPSVLPRWPKNLFPKAYENHRAWCASGGCSWYFVPSFEARDAPRPPHAHIYTK